MTPHEIFGTFRGQQGMETESRLLRIRLEIWDLGGPDLVPRAPTRRFCIPRSKVRWASQTIYCSERSRGAKITKRLPLD